MLSGLWVSTDKKIWKHLRKAEKGLKNTKYAEKAAIFNNKKKSEIRLKSEISQACVIDHSYQFWAQSARVCWKVDPELTLDDLGSKL